MGGTLVVGSGEETLKPRGRGQQLPVTAWCGSQDGERCPVCPAQGGEGHGPVPLPRKVQAPQGTAVLGTGRGAHTGDPVDGAMGGPTPPCSAGRGSGTRPPRQRAAKPRCKSVPLKASSHPDFGPFPSPLSTTSHQCQALRLPPPHRPPLPCMIPLSLNPAG